MAKPLGEVRVVVVGVGAVPAEVAQLVGIAQLGGQAAEELGFQGGAGVVGGNGDAHRSVVARVAARGAIRAGRAGRHAGV